MALRSVINSRFPTVIILGATGTGKTKLSVELAQRFNTEIICADSMQIYKGLDVVTAKATLQERSLVTHHLVDLLEPHQAYTVVDFRNRALKIIEQLIENEKIPIVVGGTTYYMESLVWNILIEPPTNTEQLLWELDESKRRKRQLEGLGDERQDAKKPNIEADNAFSKETNATTSNAETELGNKIDKQKLLKIIENPENLTCEEIHQKLKEVDPVMAGRLHPNNRRKMLRSIEIWLETGKRHSEILDAQRLTEGLMRRPGATLILWLKCEQPVHDKRLDDRVESMIQEGLIEELLGFHERYNKERLKDGRTPDYTTGVYQTVGFKEFHEYLVLAPEHRQTEEGKKLLQLSVDTMKMGTKRYARKQNRMVLSRFAMHPGREIPPIYSLDTTDLTKWDECVKNKAIHIIESFVNGSACDFEPVQANIDEERKSLNGNSSNFCEVCNRILIGDNIYKIHLGSNKHKKMVNKLKKVQENNQEKTS